MKTDTLHTTLAIAALHSVYDPEIGLNVVDLGLIYTLEIKDNVVSCIMTLTSSFCPMGDSIVAQVEQKLRETFPDKEIKVELTFKPPWGPDRISESGREFLNQ